MKEDKLVKHLIEVLKEIDKRLLEYGYLLGRLILLLIPVGLMLGAGITPIYFVMSLSCLLFNACFFEPSFWDAIKVTVIGTSLWYIGLGASKAIKEEENKTDN